MTDTRTADVLAAAVVVRSNETRRTETPNGVMTTLASPTQGGAASALWRVEMAPDRQGPLHAFDVELLWTFLAGGASVELGEETVTVAAGDTLVLPAGLPRRLTTGPAAGFTAVVTAPAGALASRPDQPAADPVLPAWIA
ncbi:cupin domain-containing protein [Kitasatospora sp. NPDC054939]